MGIRRDIKSEIVRASRRLFFSKGYKKVTVDDIAAVLTISKKTIYKHFKSKREILERVFEDYRNNISQTINEILDRPDLPFPDKLKQIMSGIGIQLGGLSPVLLRDIRESVPDLWNRINTYKQEAAFSRFNKLIEEGRVRGHIKPDVNRAVTVALYASAIEHLLDPAFIETLPADLKAEIPSYSSQVFDQALKIIYEGILTPETINSLK